MIKSFLLKAIHTALLSCLLQSKDAPTISLHQGLCCTIWYLCFPKCASLIIVVHVFEPCVLCSILTGHFLITFSSISISHSLPHRVASIHSEEEMRAWIAAIDKALPSRKVRELHAAMLSELLILLQDRGAVKEGIFRYFCSISLRVDIV